jgi:hypothetical protein
MMRSEALLSISFVVILAEISKARIDDQESTLPLLVVVFENIRHRVYAIRSALIHPFPGSLGCKSKLVL